MKKSILIFGIIAVCLLFTSASTENAKCNNAPIVEKVKVQWMFTCYKGPGYPQHYTNCQCGDGKCLTWPYECPTCGAGGSWTGLTCVIW